jgi:hypothetical protein
MSHDDDSDSANDDDRNSSMSSDEEDEEEEEYQSIRDKTKYFSSLGVQYTTRVISKLDDQTTRTVNKWIKSTKRCTLLPKNISPLIASGKLHKCELLVCKSNDKVTSILCTADIQKGECIGVYTGCLRTLENFNEYVQKKGFGAMEQLWAYDIPADRLSGYHGPDLVIESTAMGNETRFIPDANWIRKGNSKNNVEPVVIWTKPTSSASGGIYIVFVTSNQIKKGQQILMNWGGDCWKSISLSMLEAKAGRSLMLHCYYSVLLKSMEKNIPLQRHRPIKDIPEKPRKKVNSSRPSLLLAILAKQRKCNDLLEDDGVLINIPDIQAIPVSDGFKAVESRFAYSYSKCKEQRQIKVQLYEKTMTQLQKAVNIMRFPLLQERLERFYPKNSKEIRMIMNGYTPKCTVAEVVALCHPVRYYTPPCVRAYAMIANDRIAKAEPIGIYVGTLWEENKSQCTRDKDQVYAYSISKQDIGYKGPDLVVENKTAGNECRFINDCFMRSDSDRSVNVTSALVWAPCKDNPKNLIPCILYQATSIIQKGDEIVTDYGFSFWKKVINSTQASHDEYQYRVTAIIRHLEQLHKENKVPVPARPKEFPPLYEHLDYGLTYNKLPELPSDNNIVVEESDKGTIKGMRARKTVMNTPNLLPQKNDEADIVEQEPTESASSKVNISAKTRKKVTDKRIEKRKNSVPDSYNTRSRKKRKLDSKPSEKEAKSVPPQIFSNPSQQKKVRHQMKSSEAMMEDDEDEVLPEPQQQLQPISIPDKSPVASSSQSIDNVTNNVLKIMEQCDDTPQIIEEVSVCNYTGRYKIQATATSESISTITSSSNGYNEPQQPVEPITLSAITFVESEPERVDPPTAEFDNDVGFGGFSDFGDLPEGLPGSAYPIITPFDDPISMSVIEDPQPLPMIQTRMKRSFERKWFDMPTDIIDLTDD